MADRTEPTPRTGPCAVQTPGKCHELLKLPVKRWFCGKVDPYKDRDVCDAYACKKGAGVEVEKTGSRKRQKSESGNASTARGGGGAESVSAIGDDLPEPIWRLVEGYEIIAFQMVVCAPAGSSHAHFRVPLVDRHTGSPQNVTCH